MRLLLLLALAIGARAASFDALAETAGKDLSPKGRLEAAIGALAFPGGKTMAFADSFMKSEPGFEIRRDFLVALATAPAFTDNPDATRLVAAALTEDPSPEVRRAAASALGARGDVVGIGAVRQAAKQDADRGVREAAERSLAALGAPRRPKARPKTAAPVKEDAVKGKDPCPQPAGWCECAGAIRRPAKCLSLEDCRELQSEMRHHDLVCRWNSQDLTEIR